MWRAAGYPRGERVAALEQWLWSWPRGNDLARDTPHPPMGGGGGKPPRGIAMPSATRRGQHSPRKCQSHRESGQRTTGQRFGILCSDQPKESRQCWGYRASMEGSGRGSH